MAFSYMHLIERWGTGMLRVAKMIKEAGLGELEILGGETELRFNIYRKQAAEQVIEQVAEQANKTEQDTEQTHKTEQATEQDTEQTHKTEQAIDLSIDNNQKLILDLLCHNRDITITDMAKKLEWGRSKVVYYIEKLKQNKIIERVGSSQKGYWKVTIGEKDNG
ncbi:winged helix-turn-helix transcriptional regulator [Phascolarctobacterium succinatutens]|uniref:winged helix-turn-helix transcriptional regulator n=1 Tax=Phascolarctobacterium succinatutens TaxID=626940 RepID=UPI0026ED7AC7|nr:winged helix-turn-helix transcriptional regulator [Phascolarctobacterium succinatutens]MBS5426400.1 winged helix-turn-helix transcriptional regulator [Phascolarctobacterium succinatutens]